MLIRHPGEETLGQAPENAFVAYDDHGVFAGASAVCESLNELCYPDRPLRYKLDVSGTEKAFGVLVGAAYARAMMLRVEKSQFAARIYMECDADDEVRISEAKKHGFVVDDELVEWRKSVAHAPVTGSLPEGYVAMWDLLDDEIERNYFCQRFAHVMAVDYDVARVWTREKRNTRRFARMLVVDRDGLAGELLVWAENRVGEIGYLFVNPECRGKGVGGYLLEMARDYLYRAGIRESTILVPKSMTDMNRRVATEGYRPADTVKVFAGVDL